MRQIETYSYTIATGETLALPAANDNFIILAATCPVTVRGDTFGTLKNLVAGQGLKLVPFNRLELVNTSGAPNTVSILLSPAEFVNQVFSGSVNVVGALSLDAPTMNTLNRPELPTGNWNSVAAIAANTAVQIFSAAANTNGAVLWAAAMTENGTPNHIQSFLAKATAPASVVDGDVLLLAGVNAVYTTDRWINGVLTMPQRIAPGLGLFFISQSAATVAGARHARYSLL